MNITEALELLNENKNPLAVEFVKQFTILSKDHTSSTDRAELEFVMSDLIQQKEIIPRELTKVIDFLDSLNQWTLSAVTGKAGRRI